jgi:hypothetical protein
MPIKNDPITSKTDIESLVVHAISEIPNLYPGEKFMVRDLFLGYEWNRLSNYVRANVGSGFYHQYAQNDGSQVIILEKSARNQQIYSKK